MNLAEIKNSSVSKRKLFQVERAVVREAVNIWFEDKAFFDCNFAECVDITFRGRRIAVQFTNRIGMLHGSPEATVNEMMRGLILTMVTDQRTGGLLNNHAAIIGNILDVFVHRLKELWEKKYIFQRLQSLELGFDIAFGLGREFVEIKKARRYFEDALLIASYSTAEETVSALAHDMAETEALMQRESGVTFHIFMARPGRASFISLPLGMEQTHYVPLLGTHTLRCNILGELSAQESITSGILKIDAPSNPRNFLRHKGIDLDIRERQLMDKLRSVHDIGREAFSEDEHTFLKLLYNEYVMLAAFLLSSTRVADTLRLLIIFPRINIFRIMHAHNPAIPPEEPLTLGTLAALADRLFPLDHLQTRKKDRGSQRIPESVIQEKVLQTVIALARFTLQNIYKPLSDIKRNLVYYVQRDFSDPTVLDRIKRLLDDISLYLKTFNSIQRVMFTPDGSRLDIAACLADTALQKQLPALDEIVANIQAAEAEQIKEVIVTKMLDYLSFVTVRLEQLGKVSSSYIKQEVVKEMETYTATILLQARSYYKLVQQTGLHRRAS